MAARLLVSAVRQTSADMVWQVGDFGYWPRVAKHRTENFLEILSGANVPVYFADGNHEDHKSLGSLDSQGVFFLYRNIGHVRRGTVLGIANLNVLFFGGAHSVDRTYRTSGMDWFPEEVPSIAQWEYALEAENVDVVIAHDVPGWVDFGYPPVDQSFWPQREILASESFRRELGELSLQLKPRFWFGGHHHVRRTLKGDDGMFPDVHVLNCDGYPGTFVLFDTESFEVSDVMLDPPSPSD